MINVLFPQPQFNIKKEGEASYVFDAIRKTWLLLTEEEWVRQNFVAYLIKELHYPVSVIALEKGLMLNELKKRFDILVYNKDHQPWMMIECKAPQIILSEDVLQQVLRYNISVPVQYIVITNGIATIAWEKKNEQLQMIESLPAWEA